MGIIMQFLSESTSYKYLLMKRNLFYIFAVIAIVLLSTEANAQQFLTPSYSFSEKKLATITMQDGTAHEAKVTKIKRKKGQISKIKSKDANGKKIKLTPAKIDNMYLPQSLREKLGQVNNFLGDAKQWNSDNLDNMKLADGYAYFESTDVKMGKKTRKLLMQLLNPSFSAKVKVYNDPFAKESAGLGVGGVNVIGGDAKSYYFKKGDQPAYKLDRKTYKKEFATIWSDCPAMVEKYGKDVKWTDLAKHVSEYTTDCK